ncbi:hypothetical protein PFISCL1PPCAC_22236, partial [Pristionchus fissidentatus]
QPFRIETRIKSSRQRDFLVNSSTLYQPDTNVRLLPHKDATLKHKMNTVSSMGNVIQIDELDGNGRLKHKKDIALLNDKDERRWIVSFDSFYDSSDTIYIITGSNTPKVSRKGEEKITDGEISIMSWNSTTDVCTSKIIHQDTRVDEVHFFRHSGATDAPQKFAYLNHGTIKVGIIDHIAFTVLMTQVFALDGLEEQRLMLDKLVCVNNGNNELAIWTISDKEVTCTNHDGPSIDHPTLRHSFDTEWQGTNATWCMLTIVSDEDSSSLDVDMLYVIKESGHSGI